MKRILQAVLVCLLFASGALAASSSRNEETAKLHRLFDEEWEWTLREFPEYATSVGDNRYNDKLTDLSAEAIERRKAHERELLKHIRGIDRSRLSGQDILSYDLFLHEAEWSVSQQRFPCGKLPSSGFIGPIEWMPISQMHGIHLSIPALSRSMPFRVTKDYDNFLARLEACPNQIEQIVEIMKRSIASGWMLPAIPMGKVPAQIEAQLFDDAAKSPLYKPFEEFPDDITASDRSRLTAESRRVIMELVIPALRRLNEFIKVTYLPACRLDIAVSNLPGRVAYYESAIRELTTTNLSAREIHEIGLREVARIRTEMDAVIKQTGFDGSFQTFLKFLQMDKQFFYTRTEEILPGYRDIAKRVDPELPKLFAELPRTPYGIREIPAYQGETAEHYSPGAADGSRAGYFNANTSKVTTRAKYEMEALFLHEGVPGHHLQITRAQELKGLPQFWQNGFYVAYGEGWALYAESLGEELGLYRDPYSKFGQLNAEMHRACRLVVDTGIHTLGLEPRAVHRLSSAKHRSRR